jgi:hypothetical protein
MKKVNGLLNKITNRRTLELETFDVIDIFASDFDEQVEQYKQSKAALEIVATDEIIPFIEMTTAEKNVWQVYCPTKSLLKEYRQTMPLEVIKLAEEVQKRGYFHKIEVWSEHQADIDPILVGYSNDTYSSPMYLLARWGASLRPYEEVREIAIKLWKESRIARAKQTIKDTQRKLEDVEEDAIKHFNGNSVWDF